MCSAWHNNWYRHYSKLPTKSPIISSDIIHKLLCLSNAGGSFDGTYISNGTLNGRQIFIKSYLPQLQRPFIYLFYYNNSWLVYRDYNDNKNLWFLKCSINTFDVIDCNKKFTTSWSDYILRIHIFIGEW